MPQTLTSIWAFDGIELTHYRQFNAPVMMLAKQRNQPTIRKQSSLSTGNFLFTIKFTSR
jgi:hypothetical protein